MQETYRPDLQAHVLLDNDRRVRAIRHTQQYWESPKGGGLATAVAYLREMAGVYELPSRALDQLETRVNFLDPREQGVQYRLDEERRQFDSETFGFHQTCLNVPVWLAGLRVTVKHGPTRVVASEDTTQANLDPRLPEEKVIDRYRRLFLAANAATLQRRALRADPDLRRLTAGKPANAAETEVERESETLLRELAPFPNEEAAKNTKLRFIRGRFYIYRYDPAARLPPSDNATRPHRPLPSDIQHGAELNPREVPRPNAPLPFALPEVSADIKPGSCHLVAEITFEAADASDRTVWRVLVELVTRSILYIRPLSACVNGLVFENDPITKTGTTTPVASSTNAVLNPLRDDVLLPNLVAPVAGTQHLTGSFAEVTQVEGPNPPTPTEPVGTDFDFAVRTDNFAAVSGYFHVDRIFRTMQDLGFNVGTYMANTVFPIPVDIRCFNDVNAHCVGDGMGGIDHAGYGIMDNSLAGDPLGRACDPRVHLHEVLGHGILYEAVNSPNMGFTHSAGDALSLIYFDPDSHCKGVDGTPLGKPGDLRFTYVPWHPFLNRRCDRDVAAGWGWNGWRDDGGYGSEEILATTLFRFYRSIGGDHSDLGRRQFASRLAMYLILRAIGDLTPATNPAYARNFAAALMATDALNWTTEGVYGGAYHKVIRWAFERQGEYQVPLVTAGSAADGTITTPGKPPEVDVYIDDGRDGEYAFQEVHWHTTTVWNRRSPDGLATHEEPELGATNYVYVKIKNRGTQQAQNVVVRGYHTKPGAGLNWPADFSPFTTPSISVGTLNPDKLEEKLVGPFEWTPNINAYGHDCLLMVVSADGDAANVDNFTAGETIPEWRLVPNDNNIAQRNVNPVPAAGGEQGLLAGLQGVGFVVGNPNPRRSQMTFRVRLPEVLTRLGWRLELVGVEKGFSLPSGAKRDVFLKLHPGKPFTREAVEAATDRDIRIDVLANNNLIGGMTYRLDPQLARPWNAERPTRKTCLDEAQRLVECLGVNQPVSALRVDKLTLTMDFHNQDCCQ
jgi:hypothetical protein